MLFWQRKSTHKNILMWIKLAGMSAAIHITLLGLFFFVFKDRTSRLSLIITPDLLNRDIKFTIAPSPKSAVKAKSSGKTAASAAEKKAAPEKKEAPKPAEKKQTTIAAKKTVEKKATPKKAEKKVAADKKVVPEKKAEPEKKAPPAPPAKEEAANPVEKKIEPPIASSSDTLAQVDHHELEINKLGLYEKGLLEEFKVLHEEIVAQWAPPPGIAPGCSCKVTMLIDWEGVIRNFTVNESSGVLVYDIAAQKALSQVKMPKWTWGKEITITFNQ